MSRTAATPAFAGFAPEAFRWFAGLEADNSREWFAAHRDIYEREVRGALEAMLEELAGELGGRVKLFRQHRDVRFSADKAPYKTRTYGVIADRPGRRGALYAQLSAGGLFAGSGYHVLAADQLARMREAVVDDAAGPEGIARDAALGHARAAWAACTPLDAWLADHVGPTADAPLSRGRPRAARPAPGRRTPGSR